MAVESVAKQGKICVLDIDVQGAEQVKKSSIRARYVFIAPPSIEELEKRLRGRFFRLLFLLFVMLVAEEQKQKNQFTED